MKISYAVTVCNELEEIQKLLNHLIKHIRKEDEIIILWDAENGTRETWKAIMKIGSQFSEYNQGPDIILHEAKFDNHFADWKNLLTSYCTGGIVFQLDADEIPHKELINSLPLLFEMNPDIDMFLVPRINIVKGITKEHLKKWGWTMNEKKWINWSDYQGRIYKNNGKIEWEGKVHEKLEGHKNFTVLPAIEEYCLYHHKDIKKQEKQNLHYETL